ncbi:putative sugar kinase [Sulfuracidifex tepidarius]|uniref:Ribokinase n=1 Tax=Sulfuracidifex tepidarius TaxID=1294262 RepID=A0A510E4Y4_9CREN|nr:putative sugar kinase [Sulfuracidifex tepidarius]
MVLIHVVGSYNLDLTVKVDRFPEDGETTFSNEVRTGHGGKGSNQAVSASRLSSKVKLYAAVGNDDVGRDAISFWESEGVDHGNVKVKKGRTGSAIIIVDKKGKNRIIVNRGSNLLLDPEDVDLSSSGKDDVLLTQMEVKESVVKKSLREFNGIRILNPAPSIISDMSLLEHVDILTPNEIEFKELTSTDDIQDGINLILKKVRMALIITLGERGVIIATRHKRVIIDSVKVNPIDTTGAGDVFNAALAFAIEKGTTLEEAVGFANAVAGLSVTIEGALGPKLEEVKLFLDKLNIKMP